MSPIPLLMSASMAHGMGQTIVFAVLAPLGRELGLPEVGVGLIIAASSVVFSMASPLWGRASETLGRRRTLIFGLLGYTLGTSIFASVFLAGMNGWIAGGGLLATLVVARMFQSTLMAAGPPAITAYMADITTRDERTAGMAKLGAAGNIGTIAGPALGGMLATFGLLVPLFGAAMVTLVCAFFVWRWLPESPHQPAQDSDGRSVAVKVGYFDPRVFPYLVLGVALYIGFSVIQQTLGFFVQDRLQVSATRTAQLVGFALMACAASALATQAMASRFHWHPRKLLWTGFIALMLGAALLSAANTTWTVAAAMMLVGIGTGTVSPGYTSAASASVSADEQGAVAGLVAAAPAMGYVVGPLAGTSLYMIHPHAPHVFVAVSCVPLLFYLHWLGRRIP